MYTHCKEKITLSATVDIAKNCCCGMLLLDTKFSCPVLP